MFSVIKTSLASFCRKLCFFFLSYASGARWGPRMLQFHMVHQNASSERRLWHIDTLPVPPRPHRVPVPPLEIVKLCMRNPLKVFRCLRCRGESQTSAGFYLGRRMTGRLVACGRSDKSWISVHHLIVQFMHCTSESLRDTGILCL